MVAVLTGSVFDLPPERARKADPALISSDEVQFGAISRALEAAIAEVSERLDTARRARGGVGQQALDRDLEVHRLAARLGLLRRYGVDLCLGRMVFSDGGETLYVGRAGLHDVDGRQLLVDWRSAAAEPFFAATRAHPMGLAARRRYRWTGGRISDYWDEVLTADGAAVDVAADEESAFIASLGASRSSRMRDVLATIQADQDAIIRAPSAGALVVEGGPGTGKTVVALHRAAYLLYADPRVQRHRGGLLVVGPSQPYLDYVADVLPSLGEQRVLTCTLADLVPWGQEARPEADPRVASLKASAELVLAVEAAVGFFEEPPMTGMTVATPWDDVEITGDDWRDAFDAPEPDTPHNEARTQIWDQLLSIIVTRHRGSLPADTVRRALAHNHDLLAAFARAWPALEASDVIGYLWTVPAYLRRCAPWLSRDDVQALQREDPQAWTESDLPLLDAARRRLGDLGDRNRARDDAVTAALERERMDRVIDELIEADEEGMFSQLRQPGLRGALTDEADDVAPADPLAGPFAHIVVDEAQELTDAEWQMLLSRCPSRSFTIVGDRAQARHGFTERWPQRLQRIGVDDVTTTTLTINYRTPAEIMAVAAPGIRRLLPDATLPTSVRHSRHAVARAAVTELNTLVHDWLQGHPEGTACVIGAPGFPATARVRSLSPEQSKGLEFDLVVLVHPDRLGTDLEGAVDRYVSMTRATQHLILLE